MRRGIAGFLRGVDSIPLFVMVGAIITIMGLSSHVFAQSVPDLPTIDPGNYIGVPSPSHTHGGSPTPSQQEEIPIAEPIAEYPVPPQTGKPAPIETHPATVVAPSPEIGDINLPRQSSTPVEQNQTQIAILGYHNFSETKPPTDMRIRTSLFRKQMEALKASGTPIISMQDFSEWKNGNRKLPANCVMITIDDGWKSVYTDAYPILKQLGIPFTIFPYTQFLTGQGASLSINEVKEMARNGATIGSHSTSHLYPSAWKKEQRKGAEAYQALLDREIRDSRVWLQKNFSAPVDYYCYPGGYHSPEMVAKIPEYGYTGGFTVIGQKVLHNADNITLPRYIIYGKQPNTFVRAVTFHPFSQTGSAPKPSLNGPSATRAGAPHARPSLPPPAQVVFPLANSTIPRSMPTISISLGKEQELQPTGMEMRVSGFGIVPAQYKAATGIFSWTPNRPLRTNPVTILVTWKTGIGKGATQSATWQFIIHEPDEHVIPSGVVQ